MAYTIIETEFMGAAQKHVIVDRGDGFFESFPVNEDNPRYQQWLAEGNTPEVINETI
jgi:hypothetical protein